MCTGRLHTAITGAQLKGIAINLWNPQNELEKWKICQCAWSLPRYQELASVHCNPLRPSGNLTSWTTREQVGLLYSATSTATKRLVKMHGRLKWPTDQLTTLLRRPRLNTSPTSTKDCREAATPDAETSPGVEASRLPSGPRGRVAFSLLLYYIFCPALPSC